MALISILGASCQSTSQEIVEETRLVTATPWPTPPPENLVRAALSIRQGDEGCFDSEFEDRYEEAIVAREMPFGWQYYTSSGSFSALPDGITKDYKNCLSADSELQVGTYYLPYNLTIRERNSSSSNPSGSLGKIITATTTYVRVDILSSSEPPTPTPTPGPTPILETICDYGEGAEVGARARIGLPGLVLIRRNFHYYMPSWIESTATPQRITLRIPWDWGDAPSSMDLLPSAYTADDVVIRTESGEVVGVNDVVNVIGTVVFNSDQTACDLEVDTILMAGSTE